MVIIRKSKGFGPQPVTHLHLIRTVVKKFDSDCMLVFMVQENMNMIPPLFILKPRHPKNLHRYSPSHKIVWSKVPTDNSRHNSSLKYG